MAEQSARGSARAGHKISQTDKFKLCEENVKKKKKKKKKKRALHAGLKKS